MIFSSRVSQVVQTDEAIGSLLLHHIILPRATTLLLVVRARPRVIAPLHLQEDELPVVELGVVDGEKVLLVSART